MRDQAPIFTSISAAPRGMYAPFPQPQEHHLTTWRGRQGDFLSPRGRHSDPDMHQGGRNSERLQCKAGVAYRCPNKVRCVHPSAMPLAFDLPAGRRRNLTVGFHRGPRTAICCCRSAAVRPAARRLPRNRHRLSGECAGETEAARPGRGSRRSGRPIRGAGLADLNPSDQKRAAWRCRRGAAGKDLSECQRDASPRAVPIQLAMVARPAVTSGAAQCLPGPEASF
jgi:hypothetical protein